MKVRRRLSIPRIVVIVLLVIHILPVWLFKYATTQDGPAHVHNAHILKVYHNHENYVLAGRLRTQPNTFSKLDFPRINGRAYVYLSATCMRKDILYSLRRTPTALPPLSPQRFSEKQAAFLLGRFHFCL